jgi:hypothetical protein
MEDQPHDVGGEQTGSSDELSQILGLYGEKEVAGRWISEYRIIFVPNSQLSNSIHNASSSRSAAKVFCRRRD